MLWMEEELNYTREINILLLLHSHHPDISLSIYKRRKKILLLLHSQSGRGVSIVNLCPP